jgi:hypothetical protein
MPKMHPTMTDSEIIDNLGGTSAVADMCEIRPASVSDWRKNGIPKSWRKYLELVRPDAFDKNQEERVQHERPSTQH